MPEFPHPPQYLVAASALIGVAIVLSFMFKIQILTSWLVLLNFLFYFVALLLVSGYAFVATGMGKLTDCQQCGTNYERGVVFCSDCHHFQSFFDRPLLHVGIGLVLLPVLTAVSAEGVRLLLVELASIGMLPDSQRIVSTWASLTPTEYEVLFVASFELTASMYLGMLAHWIHSHPAADRSQPSASD